MIRINELPSIDRLHELFSLDAEHGLLIWRRRPASDFKASRQWNGFNTRMAGKPAGCNRKDYRIVGINRKIFLVHRLIYAMSNGPIRVFDQIDHIDGNKSNNRPDNLRLATHAQNRWNTGPHLANQAGFKGVYPRRNRFCARIYVLGTIHHLGTFDTPEQAKVAYELAARKFYGEFARI